MSNYKKLNLQIDESLVKSKWQGDYQKHAVLRAISQNCAALFIEMGLGKTFIIRTVLNHLEKADLIDRCVVVSPAEGVINLALEFMRFSATPLTWDDIYIVDTKHRTPFDAPPDGSPKKLIIMTYRNLIMLHDDYCKKLRGKKQKNVRREYIPWRVLGDKCCIILDECQNIKSYSSKTWKILDLAREHFPFRYIMSGTPSTKYAADLWTQMRFLWDKSVPDNYYDFLGRIACLGNQFSDYAVNYYYPDKVKLFLHHVSPLVIRQKAKGNIDLPPVIFDIINCKMSPKQQDLYNTISERMIGVVKMAGGRVTVRTLQDKFPYLSIALSDPVVLKSRKFVDKDVGGQLFNDENMQLASLSSQLKSWDITKNGKWEPCLSLIEKYSGEGRKIILWSSHPDVIDALAEKLAKFHPHRLHGNITINPGESVAERNKAVCDGFLQDKQSSLLIANYACLATAVNLTAVTRQIFWDRSWRSDIYAQAIKRSNRIGSTEPLIVNDLIFFQSIEKYQYREIKNRLDFNDKSFDENQGGQQFLSTNEDAIENILHGI